MLLISKPHVIDIGFHGHAVITGEMEFHFGNISRRWVEGAAAIVVEHFSERDGNGVPVSSAYGNGFGIIVRIIICSGFLNDHLQYGARFTIIIDIELQLGCRCGGS